MINIQLSPEKLNKIKGDHIEIDIEVEKKDG